MNKIFISILIIATFFWMNGCKKDFDPILYGTLPLNGFPQTDADYQNYTLQVYLPFNSKWGYTNFSTGGQDGFTLFQADNSVFEYFDLPSDQAALYTNGWTGNWPYLSKPDFSGDLSITRGQGHFEKVRFVTQITKIISVLDSGKISDAPLRIQLKGEAHIARGMLMFYLLYMYGPVPVILNPAQIGTSAESDLTRPSRSTFVNSVEGDLKFAADSLPVNVSDGDYGRFTKGAALTFLMRLYLMEHKYDKAEALGRLIMSMGKYSLTPGYADNFHGTNKKTAEIIWAISCDNASEGRAGNGNLNAMSWYFFPGDFMGKNQAGGWGSPNAPYMASWYFYRSFETGDLRKNTLVSSYTSMDGKTFRDSINSGRSLSDIDTVALNGAVVNKYTDDIANSQFQANDIVVCRYADVLLMLAEAINQNSGPTTEAIGLVNQIRNRAGLANLPTTSTADKSGFNEAIFAERTHEIFWEGLRLLDLVRFGKWQSALAAAGKNTACPELLPIPQYAIDESNGKLNQNPGY
jgi:starch-binding outer membrane protein, SusD/RagB family